MRISVRTHKKGEKRADDLEVWEYQIEQQGELHRRSIVYGGSSAEDMSLRLCSYERRDTDLGEMETWEYQIRHDGTPHAVNVYGRSGTFEARIDGTAVPGFFPSPQQARRAAEEEVQRIAHRLTR